MRLGIDFGTCFSFTAACSEQSKSPIPLVGNDSKIYDRAGGIPTVFFNDSENREIMGKKASEMCSQFPKNGVVYIKKDLRDKCPPDREYILGGTRFSAKNIIVKFIKFLINNAVKEMIERYPAENSKLENIAIAVPAMSTHSYREFIRECIAEASGLNIKMIELIDEPVAAALSYYTININSKITDGNCILTYDLGGGTFDTAIVEYNSSNKQKFVVKTQSGDTKTGGTDWDYELLKYIRQNHADQKLTDRDEFALLQAIIDAKIRLSEIDTMTFSHFAEDAEVNFLTKGLTRIKFEELTEKLLNRTISTVHDVIKEYKNKFGKNSGIDAIILSGGSSQMPMIKQRLKMEFPGIEIHSERPDRAIAFGAAIYAADFGNTQMIAPHTYGTNARPKNPDGITFGEVRILNYLFRGTQISVHNDGKYISGRAYYCPIDPNQKEIRFDVYESNEPQSVEWIDIGNRRPIFGITIPVQEIQGIRTVDRSFTAEFRLLQGGILELHVYDNDQGGIEVGFQKHRLG